MSKPVSTTTPATSSLVHDRDLLVRFGFVAMLGGILPVLLAVMVFTRPSPQLPTVTPVSSDAPAQSNALELAQQRQSGEEIYQNTCAVCHGPNGDGVPRLGKPLRNSAFVQASGDDELFELITKGRPVDDELNTTGALMPPRGAVELSDAQIKDVISHLRSWQDENAPTASTEAWNLKGQDGGASAQVAISLDSHPGHQLFVSSCSACHGTGAEGIEGLGLPLTTSGFVRGQSDKDLITFIKMGRPTWDPVNTTGIDMPPKGGNPAITDDQLQEIVDYLRALQEQAFASN